MSCFQSGDNPSNAREFSWEEWKSWQKTFKDDRWSPYSICQSEVMIRQDLTRLLSLQIALNIIYNFSMLRITKGIRWKATVSSKVKICCDNCETLADFAAISEFSAFIEKFSLLENTPLSSALLGMGSTKMQSIFMATDYSSVLID